MKSLSHIALSVLFALLFTSCTTSRAQTTTPTETLQPTQVITETPTQTLTITPTATEAGPKVGDQITENGYTYTYTFIPESGYYGWFRTLATIPLFDWPFWIPDGNGGYKHSTVSNDLGPTNVFVEKGVPGEQTISAITHTEQPKNVGTPTSRYIQELDNDIMRHYFQVYGIQPPMPSNAQSYTYNSDLQNGKVSYTFTVNSKKYTWYISPQSGATVYILNYDKTTITQDNGFGQWSDMPWKTNFGVAFWGVDSHGIVGAISLDKPLNQLDPFELRMLPLWHEAVVIDDDEQDNSDITDVGFDGLVQRLVQYATVNPPIIDMQYQK